MDFNRQTDYFTFSSGRTEYAHNGIVGISPEGGIFHGYDGDIEWPVPEWVKDVQPESQRLTADDMRELADAMIERWTKFKASL